MQTERNLTAAIVTGAAFLIYVLLTLPLRHWLIDDAGISFVYARNLASGFGLVSQPGVAPVEGFSNFLWVLLMVPFFLLDLFEPYLTAKLVSCALVGITFYLVYRITSHLTGSRRWAPLAALLPLAVNTSFIAWTSSGLENPLYGCLCAALAWCLIKYVTPGVTGNKYALFAALFAFGLSITRPDGVVFVLAFPVVLVIVLLKERAPARQRLAQTTVYGAVWLGLIGAFLLFRRFYFHDFYPNTYYVKGGPKPADLIGAVTLQGKQLTRFYELFAGLFGDHAWLAGAAVLLIGLAVLVTRRDTKSSDWVLPIVLVPAGLIYLLLGQDYMGEFRFATPFLVIVFPTLTVLAVRIAQALPWPKQLRTTLLAILLAALVGLAGRAHTARLQAFWQSPPVTFESVADRFGYGFNRKAEYLGLEDGSFLVPDIGGTLYYSKLRIYDLAGLCDRTIARTRGHDQQAFFDYVFDDLKPTFIHTHGYFTSVSKFDDDPRFSADYVPIRQYLDEWLKNAAGVERMSGEFVRRDAVTDRQARLDSLKMGLAP